VRGLGAGQSTSCRNYVDLNRINKSYWTIWGRPYADRVFAIVVRENSFFH